MKQIDFFGFFLFYLTRCGGYLKIKEKDKVSSGLLI